MKQVLATGSGIVVDEVPAPVVEAGTVLVRVDHSCISVGTELSGVSSAETPLWRKALADPAKVRKALSMVASEGLARTRETVRNKTVTGSPLGYSAAGRVMAIGDGVDDLRVGQAVACAGAGVANHAEIVRVPRNLVVPVPDGVALAHASTVTLGAIAMQGVRRAEPTLGETFVVLGLGVLGQLTVQLLKAAGCRVIATDLDPDRVALAAQMGADVGVHDVDGDTIQQVARVTDGIGADGVVITAATPSDEVVSTAFRMCRRKGRVVLVGDVGLDLNRADFYVKELDFRISTSYGPGRYDRRYEDEGLDYPVAYVRWTENRNMAEVLRLIADGRLDVGGLISATYPVEEAEAAYAALRNADGRPLMVLLRYPAVEAKPEHRVANPRSGQGRSGAVRLALVGGGDFAKGMHLPNIRALSDHYSLEAVVSRSGHNAVALARQYAARYSTTDVAEVLADPDIDALLIATRHNLHAGLALDSLHAGKHVLVEKPLALSKVELKELDDAVSGDGPVPVLLTGFNRRFSPFARRMRDWLAKRTGPVVLDYRMNAGYIAPDHWVQGPEGGGRNLGEACHVYDLFGYLLDARVTDVTARGVAPSADRRSDDNFVATMTFDDGSVASLTYTALGSTDHPKERLDAYVDGKVYLLDDYRSLSAVGAGYPELTTRQADKGHRAELEAFAAAVRAGGGWPIPWWQQLQATDIALRVQEQLGSAEV